MALERERGRGICPFSLSLNFVECRPPLRSFFFEPVNCCRIPVYQKDKTCGIIVRIFFRHQPRSSDALFLQSSTIYCKIYNLYPGSPSRPNELPIGRIGNPCDPWIIPARPATLFGRLDSIFYTNVKVDSLIP